MACTFTFKEVIMPLSREMRVFIIKCYFETKSYKTVRESFKKNVEINKHYQIQQLNILLNILKFTFALETKKRKEMKCTNKLLPHLASVHKLTQCIHFLSCVSVYCMLKDLHLHPHYAQRRHDLKPMDLVK